AGGFGEDDGWAGVVGGGGVDGGLDCGGVVGGAVAGGAVPVGVDAVCGGSVVSVAGGVDQGDAVVVGGGGVVGVVDDQAFAAGIGDQVAGHWRCGVGGSDLVDGAGFDGVVDVGGGGGAGS